MTRIFSVNNYSNKLLDLDQDYSQATERSNVYDENDLESNSLQEETDELRQLQRLALQTHKKSTSESIYNCLNRCLSFLTKSFYYVALLLTQALLFSTITLLFAFNILSLHDISGLFDMGVSPRRSQQQRRQNRHQYSHNHRRIGRDSDREYYQARIRRIRQQRDQQLEIPMTELTSEISQQSRYNQLSDDQIVESDSSQRLATEGNEISSPEPIMRIQYRRDSRRRRDFIRSEILRILTSSNFDNQRGTHDSYILRNLHLLQMSSLGRDFNENDYEMLSSLDVSNFSRLSSTKTQILISQLPTYQFKAKKNTSSTKDHEESDNDEIQEEAQAVEKAESIEQNNRNFCTICIEGFEEEEIIKILPCFHQFHSTCIDDWLLRKTNCPICKFDIKTNGDQYINE